MLGSELLVAPVFREDGEVTYYLPAGQWEQYITGETAKGGRWITEKHGFLSLPVYVKK